MIEVASRRRGLEALAKAYPGASVIDVTSKAADPWVKFSPFYPHGGIPVPFSQGMTAASVEGIWQGLKVFRDEGVDVSKFAVTSMKGIKRSVKRHGPVIGHRKGVLGHEVLDYIEARRSIYLPSYLWILERRLQAEVALLRMQADRGRVVLLDYETNADVLDASKPLSHAALVAAYVAGRWPSSHVAQGSEKS